MAYSMGAVVMFDLLANFPAVGSTGEMYFAGDTGLLYQWINGAFVPIVGGAQRVVPIASSATPTINANVTDLFEITALAVAITGFTVTGTPVEGQNLDVKITGTATRAITWGASFLASGSQTPLLATTATTKCHLSRYKWDTVKAAFVLWYVDATGY
jgi:hypothetical protein